MRGPGQTTGWGSTQSSDKPVVRPSGLRRLGHWAAFHASHSTLVTRVTPIGNRDTRREQFRPLTAASTLAQVARRPAPRLRSRCIVPSPHRRSTVACRSCEVEIFPPLEGGWKGEGSSMRWMRQLVNDAELSCDACMHDPHTESLVTTTANHHRGKGHEDF
jgi:hypothetical protein